MISTTVSPANERSAWVVCAFAGTLAIFMAVHFRVAVEPFSLSLACLLIAFPAVASLIYRFWRTDLLLAHTCGALAVITISGAAAGVIGLVGLRYGAPLIDGSLAATDRFIGIDTPTLVKHTAAQPALASLLGITYDSSFPLLLAVVLLLAWTRRFEQLWTLTFVFAATLVACTTISVFIPAHGAFAFYGYSAEVLNALPAGSGLYHIEKFDYYRHAAAPVISFASLQGVVTFPSFHTSLALATLFACASIRWLFIPSLLWNALVIVSTIPIGGHYAIDLPAGATLWLVATVYATRKSKHVARARAPLNQAKAGLS